MERLSGWCDAKNCATIRRIFPEGGESAGGNGAGREERGKRGPKTEPEKTTPSSVVYACFKELGLAHGITAAELMEKDRKVGGGKTVGEELQKRSELSRKYVKAEPGKLAEGLFKPFDQSATGLIGKVLNARKRNRRKKHGLPELEAYFAGEAAQLMSDALAAYDIDPAPYRNALARIEVASYPRAHDKLLLEVMLFIASGCLGDPQRAVVVEEEFAERGLGASIKTVTAKPGASGDEQEARASEQPNLLSIQRIFEGMTVNEKFPAHALAQSAEGSTIGSVGCDVIDVDNSVSRRHARVYFEDGHWYIVGLESTNGTSVVDGLTGETKVVEPPKHARGRAYVAEPVEVHPTDIICVGTTRYLVGGHSPS